MAFPQADYVIRIRRVAAVLLRKRFDAGKLGKALFVCDRILKHYPPGFFDVIVIDECHRSAFGDWHYIFESKRPPGHL